MAGASLFSPSPASQPLAARMRPRTLDEYAGQQHLLAAGKPLRRALEAGQIHSMILWGPPGTGKTTLAELFARRVDAEVLRLSAVTSGVKEIREAVAMAEQLQLGGRKVVLFVDEVHRFNKAQQDAFLPHIESGLLVFIGATTENPSFALNNALLSRARVYLLQGVGEGELRAVIERALSDVERGLGERRLSIAPAALSHLLQVADGDVRRALNVLEVAADLVADGGELDEALIAQVAGGHRALLDRQGDLHFDLLSAFHKSVRGSSPDGALYWLCRYLVAGGEPAVMARRMLAIASEDVGLADPRALGLALDAWDIFHRVGPAEGERALAEAAVYLACAPKSNALYTAFKAARALAENEQPFAVPPHLRNAPTKLMKELGYGAEYRYAHDEPGAYAAGESYLPPELRHQRFYQPSDRGAEKSIGDKLDYLRQRDSQAEHKRYD